MTTTVDLTDKLQQARLDLQHALDAGRYDLAQLAQARIDSLLDEWLEQQ